MHSSGVGSFKIWPMRIMSLASPLAALSWATVSPFFFADQHQGIALPDLVGIGPVSWKLRRGRGIQRRRRGRLRELQPPALLIGWNHPPLPFHRLLKPVLDRRSRRRPRRLGADLRDRRPPQGQAEKNTGCSFQHTTILSRWPVR